MNAAAHVINVFGGSTALARAINKPITTVQSWKDNREGVIPARHQKLVLDAAKKLGLPLTEREIIYGPARPREAA